MNVHESCRDLNMLGVPPGWSAWATRSHKGAAGVDEEFELARDRAGTDRIAFLVYGGGAAVRDLCASRGWHWAPEQSDVARGKYTPEGGEIA